MIPCGNLVKFTYVCVALFLLFSTIHGKGKKKKKKKAVDDDGEKDEFSGKYLATAFMLTGDGSAHGFMKLEQYQQKRNQSVFDKDGRPRLDKHGRPVNETVEIWVTRIEGTIMGLSPGLHGLHIHAVGNLDRDCRDTGQDFNPMGYQHGPPDANSMHGQRHVGDLGNILANQSGVAVVNMTDDLIRVTGNQSIIGRSLAVHQLEDDLGAWFKLGKKLGPPTWKEKIAEDHGNAGLVVACGVIGYVNSMDLKITEVKPDPHFIRLAVLSCVVMMVVAAVLKCAEGDKKP